MKLNYILLISILFFSQCIKERLNPYDNLGTGPSPGPGPGLCTFVYSSWSFCSNNIQTRTYTSSPSGCTGTPPADSIQRSCSLFINDLPVTDIEGNVYNTVKLGNQTWTTKNLNVGKYRNGDPIPQVQDNTAWSNLSTGAWCYYANNSASGTTYGKLYNWYAVNDPRGLAPNGYHIPSDAEWTTLIDYLGGASSAGTKMKSTSGWLYNNGSGNGSNTSGFAGLPGGFRDYNGVSGTFAYGYWWSSSATNTNNAWSRGLNPNNANVDGYYYNKRLGFSVRCLRD